MSWQIVGHEWAVSLLRSQLATGRASHAYLLCGPPQIGKTRLARTLAQALTCLEADAPCGRCAACTRIAAGSHPDVRLVDAEGAGIAIKIDQVRQIQREAALLPYEGRHRVFIVRHMDLATTEAANSLLKTLEEPPAHVVLILTAVNAEALPSTVVSRCQRLDLRPVPRSVVEATLRERGLAEDQARLLAGLSAGRIGWALQASQDSALLVKRRHDLDQLIRLLGANRVGRLDYCQKLGRDPRLLQELIELWATWWRDLLLLCGQGRGAVVNADRTAELQSLARRERLPEVWATLQVLQATAQQIGDNVNPRLAMESLMLKLPGWRVGHDTG